MNYKKNKSIGERIREARESLNLKQNEFGKLLGVKVATVSSWENDYCTLKDIKKIEKIAKLTNRSISYFLEGLAIENVNEPISPYTSYIFIPFFEQNNREDVQYPKNEDDFIPFKFRVDWLKNFGKIKDLRLWLMRDNEMRPLIYRYDICLLNIAEIEIIEGENYLFFDGYRKQVRRLQYKEADILITSPNDIFEPYSIPKEKITVLGRIRWIGHSI